jgi:hypothetical protein
MIGSIVQSNICRVQRERKAMKLSRVGKALGTFWPGRDAGACELRRWAGATPSRSRVFRLGLEVLTEIRHVEVTRIGAGRVASAGRKQGVLSSDPLRDTREFLRAVGGENKNERAEAAGAGSSSGETRRTTCFAPRLPQRTTIWRENHARSPKLVTFLIWKCDDLKWR